MRFGWVEILLVAGIILLLFGAKRVPELMKGLGRGTREFKEGLKGDEEAPKSEKSD